MAAAGWGWVASSVPELPTLNPSPQRGGKRESRAPSLMDGAVYKQGVAITTVSSC
jgi:hypothetical protein